MTHANPYLRKSQPLAAVPSGYLLAKMHGHRARLHSRQDMTALARLRTVADLTDRLYPRQDLADPLDLEQRLKSDMLADLVSFLKFLDAPHARLYAALLSRYFLQNIKVQLRRIDTNRIADEADIDALLLTLPRPWARADDRMRRADSVSELISALPMTVAHVDDIPSQEMAIDQAYWHEVAAALAALPRALRPACATPISLECDTARLLAALRAAQQYDMTWPNLAPFLPAAPGVLTTDALRTVHADPSPDATRRALQSCTNTTPHDALATTTDTEDWLWHHTVARAEDLLRHTTDGFAALIGYYYQKRAETRRLRAVSRMVRRSRPSTQIESQLERM